MATEPQERGHLGSTHFGRRREGRNFETLDLAAAHAGPVAAPRRPPLVTGNHADGRPPCSRIVLPTSEGPTQFSGDVGRRRRRPPGSACRRVDPVDLASRSHWSVLRITRPILARIGPSLTPQRRVGSSGIPEVPEHALNGRSLHVQRRLSFRGLAGHRSVAARPGAQGRMFGAQTQTKPDPPVQF